MPRRPLSGTQALGSKCEFRNVRQEYRHDIFGNKEFPDGMLVFHTDLVTEPVSAWRSHLARQGPEQLLQTLPLSRREITFVALPDGHASGDAASPFDMNAHDSDGRQWNSNRRPGAPNGTRQDISIASLPLVGGVYR